MQIFSHTATYHERLSPSLWLLGGAAVIGPMAALVFVPLGGWTSLAIGVAAAVAVIGALVWGSPVVTVRDGVLHAGRARIEVAQLGEAEALSGEQARQLRGPRLDPRGWHLIRGGIDGVVVVPVRDPDDPVTAWTISTRTPERLAAVIGRAQREG